MMSGTRLFLCALALAAAIAPAPALAAPEITVTREGLQHVPFRIQRPDEAIADYPGLKAVVEQARTLDMMSGKTTAERNATVYRTALLKDKDLKANFLFLYVEGPLHCVAEGCALFAFANEGEGYKMVTPMYARLPLKFFKQGKDVALVLRGSSGQGKWPFTKHAFRYGGLFIDDTPLTPRKTEPAPMSTPVQP